VLHPVTSAQDLARDTILTVRLVTLRRLVRQSAPPITFHEATPVGDVLAALRAAPHAIAILVDNDGVLTGTLNLAEAGRCDRATRARDAASTAAPILAAEDDVGAAREAMKRSDRALVISAKGELLGVLTARDLVR
jgi:CBS domain-containing protein